MIGVNLSGEIILHREESPRTPQCRVQSEMFKRTHMRSHMWRCLPARASSLWWCLQWHQPSLVLLKAHSQVSHISISCHLWALVCVRAHRQRCVYNWKASAHDCVIYLRYQDWYHCIHYGTGLRQNENVGWKMASQCVLLVWSAIQYS